LLQGFGLRADHHLNRLALTKTGVIVCSEDDFNGWIEGMTRQIPAKAAR